MKTGWKIVTFDEAIDDASGGNVKTPQSEFLTEGQYAIVDQGKELISGYVNDKSRLCHSKLPLIIFGDHTRCFKYIDFPFCMGADGVKVLRPKIDANVKYLYYFFQQLHLVENGYSRHFKYLKRNNIILPPLSEQRRIVDVLDQADALRAKRRATIAQLDKLIQSIFTYMFGDLEFNSKFFQVKPLSSVVNLMGGYAFSSSDYVAEGIPLVRIGEVNHGGVKRETCCLLPETFQTKLSRFIVYPGDMLMSLTGTTGKEDYGNVILLNDTYPRYFLNQRVALIKPDKKILDKYYLFYSLKNTKIKKRLIAKGRGIRQANISNADILELSIPLPPLELQNNFGRLVSIIEKQKCLHHSSLNNFDALFASLQHRAFRGEL